MHAPDWRRYILSVAECRNDRLALYNRPAHVVASASASTPSSSGTHDGYYYNWQTDGIGDISYGNLAGGRYNVIWTGNSGTFVGGKGWEQGSARRVKLRTRRCT